MPLLPKFQSDKLLKEVSTFSIGGPARYFVEVESIDEMQSVIQFCHQNHLPFFILGKGSNCLFDDRGIDAVVIHNKISYLSFSGQEVDVGAGYSFSLLGLKTAKQGLAGLEFASGIPASVGGAIFMNAGASGSETSEPLIEVSFVDEKGALHQFKKDDLHFSYRHSCFQEKKGAIVSAKFLLKPSLEARSKQLSIIQYRTETQPYADPSIGCFFKNPPGYSAGALIEKAGLKGFKVGGAQVSDVHANFIVNKEGALAEDVLVLAKEVQKRVKEALQIELEQEARCIPYQIE